MSEPVQNDDEELAKYEAESEAAGRVAYVAGWAAMDSHCNTCLNNALGDNEIVDAFIQGMAEGICEKVPGLTANENLTKSGEGIARRVQAHLAEHMHAFLIGQAVWGEEFAKRISDEKTQEV